MSGNNNEDLLEHDELLEHEGLEGQTDQEFTLDDMMGDLDQPTPEQAKAQSKAEKEQAELKERQARVFADQINGTFWWVMGTGPMFPNAVELIDDDKKQAGVDALLPLARKTGGQMPPWLVQMLEKYDWAIAAGMYFVPTVRELAVLERKAIESANAANDDGGTGTDGD